MLLAAMQDAAVRLVSRRPTVFFTSASTFEMEIASLTTEVGAEVAEHADWQALTRISTMTGDGSTTEFPLPPDYDRMLIRSDMLDSQSWAWGYERVNDINDWLLREARGITSSPGSWILYGNEFRFLPAPPTGQTAQFPYISKHFATGESGAGKSRFTADSDTFFAGDRLMTLGLVWMWRKSKQFEWAADHEAYLEALEKAASRDKGSRIIRTGRMRVPGAFRAAYPLPLG